MAETNKSGANPNSFPTLCAFCYLQHPAKRRRVRCKVASGKTPSTPTLLRWPSRWGLCGRCSHFDRTIHATHCQRCVWRHLAWTVIFGLRHAAHRQPRPRRLPLRYAPISTMHICIAPYTSVWLYLQPHHAPHLFAEGPAVRLAIWRI